MIAIAVTRLTAAMIADTPSAACAGYARSRDTASDAGPVAVAGSSEATRRVRPGSIASVPPSSSAIAA